MERFKSEVMEARFFEDTALIGIASASPAYRLCWLINSTLEMNFVCDPEMTSKLKKNNVIYFLPVYEYLPPDSSHRYILYKLKHYKISLLPEIVRMDYLWLIQSSNPEKHAIEIKDQLRKIQEVTLSQILDINELKNFKNLLV